jgi:adenine-specific DNA methylase
MSEQLRLPESADALPAPLSLSRLPYTGKPRAIETSSFPFEQLSEIADQESWRKEITRPLSHIHKWWAQRLGSVFRAIILATFSPSDLDIMRLFYAPARLKGVIVFDPFMGSGTTVTETLKLGASAIGRDINPVAYFLVKNAVEMPERSHTMKTFDAIRRDVADEIHHFYKTRTSAGLLEDVLYYFWVRTLPCPQCSNSVDLFSSYVFARHAYASRFPEGRAICPYCGAISRVRVAAERLTCAGCQRTFRAQSGPVQGSHAVCPKCDASFPIAKTATLQQGPTYRMYAKMIVTSEGKRDYLPINESDFHLYSKAEQVLRSRGQAYPVVPLSPGYNTNQAIKHGFLYWHQFFNARQLLCLTILADRIRSISDARDRSLFACLFSGVLEFNNMFTSFKGEGTGAVRHMFYHHILKPERTPLEGNVWGTPKSSGAFSTLFRSRILRAIDYRENPFEIQLHKGTRFTKSSKVTGLSEPLVANVASSHAKMSRDRSVYLSCGDSASTDLPAGSVDAVITDPPFFDNVNYSQLADFFYVWQQHIMGNSKVFASASTRSDREVQNMDAAMFEDHLADVFLECRRVLRPSGLLVFTYHHSRPEGWRSVLGALLRAGFVITGVQPIRSEMSVATPKHLAKEPISIDMILACRKKRRSTAEKALSIQDLLIEATREAGEHISRFRATGKTTTRGDARVILMAHLVSFITRQCEMVPALNMFDSANGYVNSAINELLAPPE